MTTAASQGLEVLPLEQLFPSPTNPRKTFDDAKLVDLARSIEEVGILEPLIVRPWHNPNPNARAMDGARYEIVAGERRYRAARATTTTTAPCMVRDLTDVQVLEIQIIENNQRDDVHPLEEADGYATLMKSAGYDAAEIARKIGRSEKYVYDRIKLLQLIPELKKAFIEGEITAGHAILLARLSADGQRQVLGVDGGEDEGYEDGWLRGGLFKVDYGSADPVLELGDDDEDEDARKPVSVRELDTYIREHVRFRPEDIDLPNLFPETAAALEEATAQDVKVVHITYEYRVADSARDESVRTYGQQSWKRADGAEELDPYSSRKGKKSKTCDHSVLGLVVAGPGNGTAFKVCVAKKKCAVHWAAEIKEAEKRAKERESGGSTSKASDSKKPSWQIEQEKREAERARWKPAIRELAEAAVEAIKMADPQKLFDIIDEELAPYGRKKSRTTGTLEERVRSAVELLTGQKLDRQYPSPENITEWLKALGVDAKKIVDRVSPKPKPEKKAKASADPKRKGARARRREKKAAAS